MQVALVQEAELGELLGRGAQGGLEATTWVSPCIRSLLPLAHSAASLSSVEQAVVVLQPAATQEPQLQASFCRCLEC